MADNGDRQKALQRAKEEAAAATEASIERARMNSYEQHMRIYNERRKARESHQTGETCNTNSPDVPARSTTLPRPDVVMEDDSDGANMLAAFKPRKQRTSLSQQPGKSTTGNTDSIGSTVSRDAASPQQASIRTEKGKGKASSGKNRQPLSTLDTRSSAPEKGRRSGSSPSTDQAISPSVGLSSSRKSSDGPKSLNPAKRPSFDNGRDNGRYGLLRMAKIPRRTTMPSPQTPDRSEDSGSPMDLDDERPPEWYRNTALPTTRDPRKRGNEEGAVDVLLGSLRKQIDSCRESLKSHDLHKQQTNFTDLRDRLHKIIFKEVTPPLLKLHRMLHNDVGLPTIFDPQYNGSLAWPFDVKADAEEVYNKWARKWFETDVLRGINKKAPVKGESGRNNSSIQPGYPHKVDAHYYGNGKLLNGQWWPYQICALRDGAHGSSQSGICGSTETGAYSCIMAGGKNDKGELYPNIDNGEDVQYCGTDSNDGKPTSNTAMMLANVENKQPVRLIRSSKLGGEFAPSVGFRYDGLYDVVDYENMDGAKSKRQRHRFHLIRREGQDPIRGGNGPAKRPTTQEEAEFDKCKARLGDIE